MEDLKDADIIIEAVFENMDVKKEIFTRLDSIARPGAVLATNTSTLDVNEIASATSRPESVIGLHFFSPANVMRLLEIVRAEKTSDSVLATSMALAKKIKKVGVVVGVCDGFVGNRMVHRYGDEARKLVEEGARPQDADAAMHTLGLPMGPFEMSDMAGLDVGYLIRQHQAQVAGQPKPDGWLDRIVEAGRKGQKTQAGIYDYPDGRKPVPAASTDEVLSSYRSEKGLTPREVGQEEATKRLTYSLVNEGAQILDEGIAQRASDIDVIYVYGYGFPAYRGGPMKYADEQGLKSVVADLEQYGQTPAPLLKRLAEEGKTFADWDREKGERVKTSDPKEQFLTAMKNCKFGIFRVQTDIQKVIEIFSQSETIERPEADRQDQIIYLDGFELIFDGVEFNRLVSVKANFRGEDTLLLNYKLADLIWLEWISSQSFKVIENLLLSNMMSFRFLKIY